MNVAMLRERLAGAQNAQNTGNSFVPAELLSNLASLSRQEADSFDFGIIKVDDSGKIQLYNQTQANFAGITPSHAEGKNFFTQIAPCSNNGLFFGSFKKGVAAGQMNLTFPYTFTFKMKPTNVNIHMYRDPGSKTNWVFCKPA
jgi:photoactive yellow protein